MNDRIAGILAEQMAFVTRLSHRGIVGPDIGRVVIDVLPPVHEPEAPGIADQRRYLRPVQSFDKRDQPILGRCVTFL